MSRKSCPSSIVGSGTPSEVGPRRDVPTLPEWASCSSWASSVDASRAQGGPLEAEGGLPP
eukprot:7741856-Pyramimonas_sp.AAC.1